LSDLVDITLSLHPGMVSYLVVMRGMRLEAGAAASVLRLDCDIHVGTHVDSPRYFLDRGSTVR